MKIHRSLNVAFALDREMPQVNALLQKLNKYKSEILGTAVNINELLNYALKLQ